MAPTLLGPDQNTGEKGDHLGIELWASALRGPRRGELWVFRAPPQASLNENEFLMRVIGVPGDTVEVVPPQILVDGRLALRLAAYGSEFLLEATLDSVTVAADHKSAGLEAGWARLPLQVIGSKLEIESDPFAVILGGQSVLKDEYGRIRPSNDFAAFGADVELDGVGFEIDGFLCLVIFRGDLLQYVPGFVRRNGEQLVEPYIEGPPDYAMPEQTLRRGEYLVMGDYRNNANDSHIWGPLTRDRFVGRVTHRYWPRERARAL